MYCVNYTTWGACISKRILKDQHAMENKVTVYKNVFLRAIGIKFLLFKCFVVFHSRYDDYFNLSK